MVYLDSSQANVMEETGIDTCKKIDPKEIKKNKELLDHKVTTRIVFSLVTLAIGIFAFVLVGTLTDLMEDTLSLIVMICCVVAIPAILAFSANSLRKNACPTCFAISPWIHFKTWMVGQEQTTVTKKIETKHYSSENKPIAGYGGNTLAGAEDFSTHRYEGKSVTEVKVPAIRYKYKKRYRCSCCGEFKDVYTSEIVEQQAAT